MELQVFLQTGLGEIPLPRSTADEASSFPSGQIYESLVGQLDTGRIVIIFLSLFRI